MVLVGSSLLQRSDASSLYTVISTIANTLAQPVHSDWRVLNVLHNVASQVGALDIGYRGGIGDLSQTKLLYLLGAVSGCS